MKVQSIRGNTKKQPSAFKHEQEEFPSDQLNDNRNPSKLILKLYM